MKHAPLITYETNKKCDERMQYAYPPRPPPPPYIDFFSSKHNNQQDIFSFAC